ncbi:MAG: 5'/3'-nucleotidase SurE [Candidatus Coatesbacteria bacterium 4484_99]|uniref:5'-nucleotidase SurE n=1 Tax=Candidatus Coatesbacteria bacterium 4484_99 TaxID=1970774 RepID=A0A1W9S217_9BACT|nr:MAG: 5'/3'-nucleotidase SurE [Candidatus Coatesbacteria bacterium 4484_99]RLC42675.1 MAG: 5'/3'-nucleotidase SurE [Candidatus Coatesbacteria bacterium]RLC44922.1 MAG: 5'/3'-nucleotidase SurE [Candidatus Coatesbacteria bacterium]
MGVILITNDDGIESPGLDVLARALGRLGEIYVIAPTDEMSACGHSISLNKPVYVRQYEVSDGYHRYGIEGTPADCVKLAVKKLLDEKLSLVVSGINRGPNTGLNILYSGTVSGALEGAILGIPSIAISSASYTEPRYDTSAVVAYVLGRKILKSGLPEKVCLNVNVPSIPIEQIKGFKITRQAETEFEEYFDDNGDGGFILRGDSVTRDVDENSDVVAVKMGYVSITPLHIDLTHYDSLTSITYLCDIFDKTLSSKDGIEDMVIKGI